MTVAIEKRTKRPSWMMPFGAEGWGDVFFDRLWQEWHRDMGEEWTPSLDFVEKDGEYHLTAELPGINKDDINVSFDNGIITISGKKGSKKETDGANYHLMETRYGSFSRSLRLPGEVDEEKVDATYKDGILTITMPKSEETKRKKIEVH